MTITIDIERFRTALLTDKINHYWDAFTEGQWKDILAIAFEHFDDETHVDYRFEVEAAYDVGYDEGKDDGYELGYSAGFSAGYDDGLYDARNEESESGV